MIDTLKTELILSDDEKYYADREHVSNSMLSLLNKSPQHLQKLLDGHQEETPALIFGSAFHTYVLEPEKWKQDVAIYDGKTRRGKAWEEFQEQHASKTIINKSEYQKIVAMRRALCTPEDNYEFIENSLHEVVRVWEMQGVKCKGKADCVYETKDGKKIIIDVKTTQDASPDGFRRSAYKYGYHRQASFYVDGFGADEFWFAVVEKDSPYRVGLYQASEDFINNGRDEVSILLETYKEYFINKTKQVQDYYFKGEL
tara:strand:+ start:349 stop:1116 length:768 start_codon:yes stop_codon:yes gene_type:complete